VRLATFLKHHIPGLWPKKTIDQIRVIGFDRVIGTSAPFVRLGEAANLLAGGDSCNR